jgi:hypothetical protein
VKLRSYNERGSGYSEIEPFRSPTDSERNSNAQTSQEVGVDSRDFMRKRFTEDRLPTSSNCSSPIGTVIAAALSTANRAPVKMAVRFGNQTLSALRKHKRIVVSQSVT